MNTGNEKGFAVILALGFLALFSMLTILFVATTMTDRKAAENYSAQTTSRLSAHTGLQRALAALNKSSGNISDEIQYEVYSSNAEDPAVSDDVKRESLAGSTGLLHTVIDNMEYYTDLDANLNYNLDNNPTWQYFPFDHGTDTPIIGRLAYVVISNFGKLDPSACIDSGVNAANNSTTAISEDAPASEATMIDASGNTVIGRPGRSVNELFLESLPSSWFTEENAQKICSDEADPPGLLSLDRWENDIYRFFDKLGVNDNQKGSFRQFFTFDSIPSPEAFWIDDDDNDIKDSDEIYHRFNLTRTDWDSLTISSILTAPNSYSNSQGGGISWLNNWLSAGEIGDSTACKNQIAANLIDYNDSDSDATTDNEDNPTYVGLEKCPYINEVKLKFVATAQYSVSHGAMADVLPEFVYVEVVDMYNTDTTVFDLIAKVNMDWQFDMGGNTYTRSDVAYVPLPNTVKQSYMSNASKFVDQSAYNTGWVSSTEPESNVTNLKITNLKVKLYENGGSPFYDFSNLEPFNYPTTESSGYNITGDLNINPGSMSSSHPFIMQTPSGQVDVDDLSNYYVTETYTGPVSELMIMPKTPGGGGTSITINSISGNLDTNTYYTFTGDMNVTVYNTHSSKNKLFGGATGKWWIQIDGTDITIDPVPDFAPSLIEDEDNSYVVPSDNVQKTIYIDYEIPDPRQNLLVSDWAGVTVYDTVDTGSLGIKNNLFVPNPGGDADMEPNVDSPWNISTAYIRNAPMQSPWELGLIHRGSKWQTINLKKCSSNESEGEGEGGGNTYSAGDANILNQVKMTSDIETYGKVNVNTNLQEVLTVLFQKIRVGSDIGSTDGPGEITGTNEVGATEAAAFASDVLDNNSTNGGTVFYSRAQILRETNGLINTLCYDSGVDLDRDNDATQEEIIGKFINLTQASGVSNIFYVIVVVQAINDIGTGTSGTVNVKGVDCQTGKYDINGDEILATQKIFVTVVRDPVDYSLKIKRFEYLDN